MKRNSVLLFGIMILFCVSASLAQSGYLKIGDIKGESTDRGHKEWIIIESVSQGLEQQQTTTATTRRRGSVVLKNLIITKKLDKATPKLMELCAKGQVVPELVLDMVANGRVYYKVTLNNVKISSINTGSLCKPDCNLVDDLSISYSKITWEYWDSNGTKTAATFNAKTGI
jgi:type VI secretion system secreted protein Hcp